MKKLLLIIIITLCAIGCEQKNTEVNSLANSTFKAVRETDEYRKDFYLYFQNNNTVISHYDIIWKIENPSMVITNVDETLLYSIDGPLITFIQIPQNSGLPNEYATYIDDKIYLGSLIYTRVH